jgi:allantoate deiminase
MSSLTADLEEAARIGAGADGGISRFAWTPELARANEWFVRRLEELGLAAEVDAAGNVIGRWDAGEGPAILTGSHLDTVPQGGRFDGALGVLAALEAVRILKGEGLEPRRPLWLISFNDEEGARFRTGMLGSRAFVGEVDAEDWRRRGVADAMAEAGFDFDVLGEARAVDRVGAYLELHIEQGPVLERLGLPLGVVLGSFGVERHRLRFTGAHAHAGATPMEARSDAFLAAARSAAAFRDDAEARADARATTGSVRVEPGIPTAFNGVCELTLDLRASDAAVLATLLENARFAAGEIAGEEGCQVAWEPVFAIEPIPFDRRSMALAEDVVAKLVGSCHVLPSGPLHDASEMARVLPAAMLFVRSLGGVSHTSAEDSRVEDVELGVRALYELTRRVVR